jgi:hypothetical protein
MALNPFIKSDDKIRAVKLRRRCGSTMDFPVPANIIVIGALLGVNLVNNTSFLRELDVIRKYVKIVMPGWQVIS